MPDDQGQPAPDQGDGGGDAPPPCAPRRLGTHPAAWQRLATAVDALMLESSYLAELEYAMPAYYTRIEKLWCKADNLVRLVGWGRAPALADSGLSYDQVADPDRFRAWLRRLRFIRDGAWFESQRRPRRTAPPAPQHVTLGQLALILRVAKRTLERLRVRPQNPFPAPDIKGKGRGKASWWVWAQVRPWLIREFGARLPERFPDFFAPQ
jgi:hypothetical protein